MDPDFPSYSAAQGEKHKHALRDVYAAVDSSIGKILKTMDDHTTIIITSVDGLGPNYAGCHLVPDVLSALGYYRTSDENTSADNTDVELKTAPKSLVKKIRDRIPYGLRRQISRYLPRHLQHQLSMKWAASNIDWPGSKAYCIPNANEGYVRINKKGREPKGIIPQGAAYSDFCNELKEIFLEIINPANGIKAVREVICPHEKFEGARVDSLPDVIVTWNFDSKVLKSLSGSHFGRVDGSAAGYQTEPFYAGNHRPVAFFSARGPTVDKSTVFSDRHIVDIAPTILSLFDIEIPSHFDGSVLEGLQ
jgi:predicted AlkP superfamily phosphohydrolase/phosphomutase